MRLVLSPRFSFAATWRPSLYGGSDVPVEEMERLVQALQAGMEAQPASLKKRAA